MDQGHQNARLIEAVLDGPHRKWDSARHFLVCTFGTGNKIIFRQAELGTLQLPADVQRAHPGEPLRQGSKML